MFEALSELYGEKKKHLFLKVQVLFVVLQCLSQKVIFKEDASFQTGDDLRYPSFERRDQVERIVWKV